MLALLALLALLAPAAEGGAGGVRITATASRAVVLEGQVLRISGTTRAVPSGTTLALQSHASGSWRTVDKRKVTRGRYAFSVSPRVGRTSYRVVRLARPGVRVVVSPTVRTRAEACAPLRRPARSTEVWFTRPGLRTSSPIATNLGKLFCTASPGSDIKIALYFARTGDAAAEVERILRPLELVHRHRGVRISFLLEGKVLAGGGLDSTLARLRRFASVSSCSWSCRNTRSRNGIMHDKFVVMSDTTLRAGVDPVTVVSSANWSYSQLRRMWQSAVVVHGDARLARELQIRWDALRACGARRGCGGWTPAHAGRTLPDAYRPRLVDGVWYDRTTTRQGEPGKGLRLDFSPQDGADPLLADLERRSCTRSHRTVRVTALAFSPYRAAVARALGRLRTEGCDVRVVLNRPAPGQRSGLQVLRASGLPVTCVAGVHDKVLLLDTVDRRTGRPLQTVTAGSTNLTWTGLRANDEAQLRMDVGQAEGEPARALGAVLAAYRARWDAMARKGVRCDAPDAHALFEGALGDPALQADPLEPALVG